MNRIEKFLRKLNQKEQDLFILLLSQLERDYTKVPGVKNLTNKKGFYSVRVGRYRLIFKIKKGVYHDVIKIAKRDNRTYKNF